MMSIARASEHFKYNVYKQIYTWNTSISETILTEHLLHENAEDLRFLEGPENLHITSQDRRKKKKRERKESGLDLRPWEGAVQKESFLQLPVWGGGVLGAEAWASETVPGKDQGWLCEDTLKRLENGSWGCTQKKPGPMRDGKAPLLGGGVGKPQGRLSLHALQGSRTQPTQALGAGTSRHHHHGLQRQAQATTTTKRPTSGLPSPPPLSPGARGPLATTGRHGRGCQRLPQPYREHAQATAPAQPVSSG